MILPFFLGGHPPPHVVYPPLPPGIQEPGPTTPQPGQADHPTVVLTQPVVTVVQTYQANPVRTTCPLCHAEIITGTHYEIGTFSWLMCVILFFIG